MFKKPMRILGEVVICEANLDDAGRISDLVSECYRHYAVTDDYGSDVIEALLQLRGSEASILELIRNENVFVAEQQEIVGMVSVFQNEITKLFVRSNVQKQALGTLLFRYAKSFISGKGFTEMFLGVAVPSAEGFYEKMGMCVARHKQIVCGPCKGRQITVMKMGWENR